MAYGLSVDVSAFQTGFDFNKINDSVIIGGSAYKINEMIIKVSEGGTFKDPEAEIFVKGCEDTKSIYYGYYHFMRPSLDVDSAKKEASFFIEGIQRLQSNPKSGYWLDLEVNTNGLSKEAYTDYIEDFISIMVGAGYGQLGIYGGASFLNNVLMASHELGRFPLWLAQYCYESQLIIPNGWKDWSKWQFTGTGKIPSFKGDVDLSFIKNTL